MRHIVAIDMRYVENLHSGLSRFSLNIFYNLIKYSSYEDLYFIILMPPKNISKDLNLINGLDLRKVKIIYSKNKRGLRWKIPFFIFDFTLYSKLRSENVEFFLSPYIDPPFLPGIKVISTIHDLIFIRVKNYFNHLRFFKRFLAELRIILTLLYSDNILTVSRTTKDILISRYQFLPFAKEKLNNITVIFNGITKLTDSKKRYQKRSFCFNNEYFLYVGDRRNHKNLFYTIELIKNYNLKFKKNFKLIIAGSDSYKNYKLKNFIKANLFVNEIINPDDFVLDELYQSCTALILLSFDEGFGIPVIEAASRSKKIILSDIKIFKEIAPSHSLILDLKQKSQHVKLLHDYINKEVKVNPQTILKKWSWKYSSLKLKKMLLSNLI